MDPMEEVPEIPAVPLKDSQHLEDSDLAIVQAPTMTLDEASATEIGENSKPEVSPGIKSPDLIDPKNSTSSHTTEMDANKTDSPDLPAKGTQEQDQPVPPPPEPRPDILNTVLPISPEEQRADKPKGKGRGKGRGRGRGKGRAKKTDVEEMNDEADNDKENGEVENEEGGPVQPLPKKASRKKSQTPAPSVPTGSSANAVENTKETEGGRKRKKEIKSENNPKKLKGGGTKATKDKKPSKATSSNSPKDKGETKTDATEQAKADRKKQISRKSSAYHTAKRVALREGKSQEEALALAKAAPRHL